MSNSFIKLLVSQLFANLADIFFRVTIIANIYIISKSVIATSLVPILIGISSFVASLLVPLVTKRIALNRVLSLSQIWKDYIINDTGRNVYRNAIRSAFGNLSICCCNFHIRWFCSTCFLCYCATLCDRFG